MLQNNYFLKFTFLSLLTFFVFSPLLSAQFTNWDDPLHVSNNLLVKNVNFENIITIFNQSINQTYIPLSTLSFCLDYLIAHDNAHIYHLINILYHLAVVLVLFFLLLKMGFDKRLSMLACVVFAIHPMHVESVAWLTQRKDVLYSLFYLLSLLFYQKHSLKDNFVHYLLSLGFGILSVLAKPMAVSLPLILILFDWFNEKNLSAKLVLEKIPFVVALGTIGLITYIQNLHTPSGDLSENILLFSWCLSFYPMKFLLPLHLNPLYEHPVPISLSNIQYVSSLIVSLGMIFLMFVSKNRILKFSLLYYFCSIFFLLRFNVGFDTHIVADRFMYLPSVGFCVWLASLGIKWINQRRFLIIVYVLVAFYMYQSYTMSLIWKNSTTLWSYVIKNSPSMALAYINRANAYYLDKKYALALDDLRQAEALNPSHKKYLIHYNRGLIDLDLHKFEEATQEFSRALKDNPFYIFVFSVRGEAYAHLGQLDLALADFNKAAQFEPYNHVLFNNRGTVLSQLNHMDLALQDFDRSVWLNPHYALGFYNRGNLQKDLKNYSLAVRDYSKSIFLNNGSLDSYMNRGICYSFLGLFDLAQEEFNAVLRLNPGHVEAQKNLELLAELKKRSSS